MKELELDLTQGPMTRPQDHFTFTFTFTCAYNECVTLFQPL